jgi:hypothetical protein
VRNLLFARADQLAARTSSAAVRTEGKISGQRFAPSPGDRHFKRPFRHVAACIRELSVEISSLWGVLDPLRGSAQNAPRSVVQRAATPIKA